MNVKPVIKYKSQIKEGEMIDYNIAVGVYQTQYGYRKDTAIIKCSYIPHKIEVYDCCGLNILDGAEVYWT